MRYILETLEYAYRGMGPCRWYALWGSVALFDMVVLLGVLAGWW